MLIDKLVEHDIDPYEVAQLSGPDLTEILRSFQPKITKRICDGLTGECVDIELPVKPDPEPVPCPVCGKLARYFDLAANSTPVLEEADLVIVDSPALVGVEAELGELIQLQGEGVEPVLQGVGLAVHEEAGEEDALALAEALVSPEAQFSLFEHADLLPVVPELFEQVAQGSFGAHARGALEHGGRPLPIFFTGGQPLPWY